MVKCGNCRHWRWRFASVGACSIVLPRWVESHLQKPPDLGIIRESYSDDSCDLGQPEKATQPLNTEDL